MCVSVRERECVFEAIPCPKLTGWIGKYRENGEQVKRFKFDHYLTQSDTQIHREEPFHLSRLGTTWNKLLDLKTFSFSGILTTPPADSTLAVIFKPWVKITHSPQFSLSVKQHHCYLWLCLHRVGAGVGWASWI